jgi:hypothetical protein
MRVPEGRLHPLRPLHSISQATKVAAHLQRTGAASGGPTFVWAKKIERELESGKSEKDIAAAQTRTSQAERLVGVVYRTSKSRGA